MICAFDNNNDNNNCGWKKLAQDCDFIIYISLYIAVITTIIFEYRCGGAQNRRRSRSPAVDDAVSIGATVDCTHTRTYLHQCVMRT